MMARIDNQRDRAIDQIGYGECFTYGKHIYMRIEGVLQEGSMVASVNLRTGKIMSFSSNADVIPTEVTVVIEETP